MEYHGYNAVSFVALCNNNNKQEELSFVGPAGAGPTNDSRH